jgi:hypothetical protein
MLIFLMGSLHLVGNSTAARPTSGDHLRSNHRQIAVSLRSLFRNEKWLGAHTVEGSGDSR